MITTKRLTILPLTVDQLKMYIGNDFSLETSLQLHKSSYSISNKKKDKITENIIPEILNNNINYLYKTIWIAIDNETKKIVSEICFKGIPNTNQEVEIGYETYAEFRGKGYMTEVISELISWAKNQPEIKTIFAQTTNENLASILVLKKNNFIKSNETQNYFDWVLVL